MLKQVKIQHTKLYVHYGYCVNMYLCVYIQYGKEVNNNNL